MQIHTNVYACLRSHFTVSLRFADPHDSARYLITFQQMYHTYGPQNWSAFYLQAMKCSITVAMLKLSLLKCFDTPLILLCHG